MNILFITPSLPTRLHRNRSFCLIKALAKNHTIHLLSLSSSPSTDPSFEEIKTYCASQTVIYKEKYRSYFDCFFALFSLTPLEVAFCKSKKMNAVAKELIKNKKIDLVYVKRLRAAQYALTIPINSFLDTTDAMSLFYNRLAKAQPWYKKPFYKMEEFKYRHYEKKMNQYYKRWIACSPIDVTYLEKIVPEVRFNVIPNIVDTEYYRPENHSFEKNSILISGLMNKFVNIEAVLFFVKQVFPFIQATIPQSKLYIVGPNPVRQIMALRSSCIEVTGYVPDLRTYIDSAHVVACPIKTGTGTRFKILQAWAMKKPVVTTTAGIEGLPGIHGIQALIADDPGLLARHIIDLFNSPERCADLGNNGYRLLQEQFSNNALEKALKSIL